jgi:hypothetical protein
MIARLETECADSPPLRPFGRRARALPPLGLCLPALLHLLHHLVIDSICVFVRLVFPHPSTSESQPAAVRRVRSIRKNPGRRENIGAELKGGASAKRRQDARARERRTTFAP